MLIVVGELMLLHEADQHGNRFWLGWVLVSSGILATMAANQAYGARYGITGALIWGWPAYSFVLVAAGMISVMKRASRRQGSAPPDAVPSPVPADAENAGLMALRATIAAGNPLSQNQLTERFGLTRAGDESAPVGDRRAERPAPARRRGNAPGRVIRSPPPGPFLESRPPAGLPTEVEDPSCPMYTRMARPSCRQGMRTPGGGSA